MSARTKVGAIALAAALALAGVACGSSDAADAPTKSDGGSSGKGDVAVDPDDGTVKYTDEDGNETEMNIDGEGASLPDGWPEDLAPPSSVTLVTASTTTVDGKEAMTVLGESDATVDDLAPVLRAQLEDAGYEITQDTDSAATGGGYAGMSARMDGRDVTVAIAEDPTGDGGVTLTMTITAGG